MMKRFDDDQLFTVRDMRCSTCGDPIHSNRYVIDRAPVCSRCYQTWLRIWEREFDVEREKEELLTGFGNAALLIVALSVVVVLLKWLLG